MPIHDWTRVDAGLFHAFHQSWTVRIQDALNAGILPKGHYALVEQRVGGPEPDVIAVETGGKGKTKPGPGGTTTLAPLPRTRVVKTLDEDVAAYARKANRITIRHQLGRVVAVIEIVSPGNKDSRNAIRSFVEKAVELLRAGVRLMVIDLFPPTPRDPQGLHKAIWDEFRDEPFELPADQPLTLVGYDTGPPLTAYIETAAVGEALPSLPLFLARGLHALVPLEATYSATWEATPDPIRELLAPAPPRRRK
ncbi:MAG TPA: DUF4058 family protein [Fimbriiglobus sp.]|nr:DUF4058 family protein [Fimbriiglobus sp.]